MASIAEMTQKGTELSDGLDSIVIRRVDAEIISGRTLDMSGFEEDYVRAGHIIIHEEETDIWKPLPVKNGEYESLPEGFTYKGVIRASKPRKLPLASIMYAGEVNDLATPYPMTETLKAALKTVLPGLYFMHD